MKNFLIKNKWELLGLFLILFVVLVNRFPEGYVIAGEDTFQRINLQEYYHQLFYEWQGRVTLFYSIFYFLDFFRVSESAQISWYLGVFLLGSYASFLAFLRLVFGKLESSISVPSALFYALNLYTLYVFTYTWGYSDFQSLYIFLPILTGTYIVFLRSQKNIYGAAFLLLLFFASSGFGNPAFAVGLLILLLFLTVFLAWGGLIRLEKSTLLRILSLGALSLFISAYWIFPITSQISRGVADLAGTNSIDLATWLQKTSTPLNETLRLGQFNSGSFFPRNNPYTELDFIKPLVLALSFLPVLFILFGIRQAEMPSRYRKFFFVFLALLVVFVALNARVRPPFTGMNNFLFQLPVLNALRSYEKIAIFTPFLMTVLVALTLKRTWSSRWKKVLPVLMLLMLLLPLPFYVGKLQQNMSFILSQRSKNFQKSTHSFLVKIPQPYYDIRETLNEDPDHFKIASLPYNTDKYGWVSYPKWKMRGNDIVAALYEAPLINPNSAYVDQWLPAKDFNEESQDPLWLVEWLGLLNTKYIIYHKDVHGEFLEKSQEKMLYLETSGAVVRVSDNEYFTLYEVKEEYRVPYVYTSTQNASLEDYSINGVLGAGKKIRAALTEVSYQAVTPKKVIVSLPDDLSDEHIILSEKYDALWQAVYSDGKKKMLLERAEGGYGNAWKINESMAGGLVKIEYLPMKLFYRGAWVSGGTLLGVILYCIYIFYAQRRKKI